MTGGELVLRGDVVTDQQEEIHALQAEIVRLRRELAMANGEIARAKTDSARAVGALRTQLLPLYRALQSVFGEMEAIGDDSGGMPVDARTATIWATWKQRLGGQCAKVIDALLLQPGMNTTQLAIAIGTHRNNVPNLILKLNKAGLINKNGGCFSLKQL